MMPRLGEQLEYRSVDPYSAAPGRTKLATVVETLTIAPPPLAAIRVANAPVRKDGALTFSR
jgi:hypothetical protein